MSAISSYLAISFLFLKYFAQLFHRQSHNIGIAAADFFDKAAVLYAVSAALSIGEPVAI